MEKEQFVFRDERGIWTEEGVSLFKAIQKPLGELVMLYKETGRDDEEILGKMAKDLTKGLEEAHNLNPLTYIIFRTCKDKRLNNVQIAGFLLREVMHMLVLKDLKEMTNIW